VADEGLHLDDRLVSWLDADDVVASDHAVRFVTPTGDVELTHLGAGFDRFVEAVHAARGPVRRAALAQATGEPRAVFTSRAGGRSDLFVHDGVLVVEPRPGLPTVLPLPLLLDVRRDGYALTFVMRAVPSVTLGGFGARTDELLDAVAAARADLRAATMAAAAGWDAALAGYDAPDGWALDRAEAGRWWGPLRSAVGRAARAEQAELLANRAADRLRIGVHTDGGRTALPFLLAPVGDRVVVEAVDADDRATFVFRTDDVDRLNAVLLLTAFRREALYLPDDQLGRWAPAVRCLDTVRWARSILHARVVHDAGWATAVEAALR
jgi:hypothetical protein